jgi:hypothetical protein
MSPDPKLPGSARPAADINDEIRDIWARARGPLTTEERRRYSKLLIEYAAAVRKRVVSAA